MTKTIRVDVWSDIACPWCYLGKQRFDQGLSAFARSHPEVGVEVEHHSFELAPDTPEDFDGSEIDFLSTHKGMPREQVELMLQQMTEMGAAEGVTYNFDRLRHANTRKAHRVLHLAKSQQLQSEMLERLYRAYFEEGVLISDPDTLAELGEEIGLSADEIRDAIDDDEGFGEDVESDITRARMLGISGVPFFLIDEKYGISGAQSAESFAGALGQVMNMRDNEHTDAR